MGTFLTTERMSPELAARVHASVRGVRPFGESKRGKWKPRLAVLARGLFVLGVIAALSSVVLARARDRKDFERARAGMLERVRAASASLTVEDFGVTTRIDAWLIEASGAYDGDFVASELLARDGLSSTLSRPAIFLRGPIAQLHTSQGIAQTAAASLKDTLVECLLDPPSSRAEKSLLVKVREVYSVGAQSGAGNVQRLVELQAGLPFLSPLWAENVKAADTPDELEVLRKRFDDAPTVAAARAAKAQLLLFAMDEPGDTPGPTELDGERPHPVRVGLLELPSGKVLLRMRKRVDPSAISQAKRPLYSAGIDGCALAFDVRASVTSL
jgi:hypothetical protein